MINVGLFILTDYEYLKVDFFDDEKISITSSIQNISDISKTYTDFSQSFTLPATKQNNKIFKHWYESSLDSGFNSNLKVSAYIELDTIPFRNGKIQLEGASVKNGIPENYKLTFIGNLTNLRDKFAGLMLKDLTSTAFDFAYSATVVRDKVTTTAISGNVMFPLISSDRYWSHSDGGSNDLDVSTNPIRYNELFPALRLQSILKMIETQFGVDFGITSNRSDFLNNNKFVNAYLWLKNKETFENSPLFQQIDFTTKGNLEDLAGVEVDLTDNYFVRNNGGGTRITITPQAGFTAVPYTVYRYLNGERWDTYVDSNGGTSSFVVRTDADNKKHTFFIETTSAFEFVFKIDMGPVYGSYTKSATMTPQVMNGLFSISKSMPEIKIEDFFTGVLKMFNLTCYSEDGINFTLQRLDEFYSQGKYIDITKYINIDSSTDINRVKSFKKINFEYEKSESIVNVGFLGTNGTEYGNLSAVTGYDGEEYSVKLPFENLNFNNLGDKFQVAYALKSDLNKYVPKPVVIYDFDHTDTTPLTGLHYHFSTALTGSGTAYTTYKAFGQEYFDGIDTWGINFGTQISTLTNEQVENGLYLQNYDSYLANIFNIKSRIIKIKTYLPTSILTTIKLNDRLIIRDKRYIINTMNLDLTSGEVQFELLNDFR